MIMPRLMRNTRSRAIVVAFVLAAVAFSSVAAGSAGGVGVPQQPGPPQPSAPQVLGVPPAFAPSPLGTVASPSQQSTPASSAGVTSSTPEPQVAVNPWGCYTKANDPHASKHGPAGVNAAAWTYCAVLDGLSSAGIEGTLYEYSCVLIFCGWNEVQDTTTTYPPTTLKMQSNGYFGIVTYTPYNCSGTHTFQLVAYGWSEDSAGNYYDSVATSNIPDVACQT